MSSEKRNDRIVDLRSKKPGTRLDQAPLPLRTQKRVSPVRVRRRRTRLIGVSVVCSLLISAALVVSFASYLPEYSVGTIIVQGAQAVPANLIADYVESIIFNGSHSFLSHANILLYPKALIEKDIPLEFPRIESATISRQSLLANSVTITVTERQPFALWCLPAQPGDQNGTCYDMDQSGFIFAQAPAKAASSTAQFVFTGGVPAQAGISTSTASSSAQINPIGQTFVPGHISGLLAFLQRLGQAGVTPLGANIESDQDFTVPLQQGFYLDASFGEDGGTLVNNVQLVLQSSALSGQQQNLEYIDLRFGDKVYYKLKGQDQTSTPAQ